LVKRSNRNHVVSAATNELIGLSAKRDDLPRPGVDRGY
jgi:hypothetical protein